MFVLVKWIEFFLAPGNALVLLVVIGAGLLWTRWRKIGVYLATATAIVLLLLLFLPVGYWIMKPLEDRYPRPAWPARVDGILVLGGGSDSLVFETRHAPAEDIVEGRLVAAAELSRRYPDARIVFSGGSGTPGYPPETEAAQLAFTQLGVPQDRITYEGRSRNTWENLVFSRQLVRPKPREVWVLATSASHLPRAMLIARRLGWHLLAWPTDYKTLGGGGGAFVSDLDLADNLESVDTGLHEWLGILAYSFS